MKLAELLPLITEQTTIELSYLSGPDTRVACRCDDVHSVIDYVREEGRDTTELLDVNTTSILILNAKTKRNKIKVTRMED